EADMSNDSVAPPLSSDDEPLPVPTSVPVGAPADHWTSNEPFANPSATRSPPVSVACQRTVPCQWPSLNPGGGGSCALTELAVTATQTASAIAGRRRRLR